MMRAFVKTAILLLMLAASALRAETAPVARVALTVGDATRVSATGVAEPLRLGVQLAVGDRIITGKDAIAILVFADEGRVSLRSGSELVIHRYNVDPSGADTRMELELVRGAMRQISGNAARVQPERYRLNTPVAAIGVRGTDFLAKTTASAIETFVQEGMIVVLPKGNGCADGAGGAACAPIASLSSSDAGQYLRVAASGQVERRAIDSEEIERVFGIRLSSVGAGSAGAATSGVVFVSGGNAKAFNTLNGREEWTGNKTGLESGELERLAAEAAVSMSQGASPAPAVPIPLPKQLVWGRFSDATALPLSLPVPFEQASQGRHVTVGELGQYALWRENPSGRLDAGLRGQVQFALAAASAVYVEPAGVSPADVRGASLVVDFDKSAFGAGVTVDHAKTGTVSFSTNGRIYDEGIFWAGNASQRVAGALSRDGKEAGYLFTKDFAQGTFKGVTLWTAP